MGWPYSRCLEKRLNAQHQSEYVSIRIGSESEAKVGLNINLGVFTKKEFASMLGNLVFLPLPSRP